MIVVIQCVRALCQDVLLRHVFAGTIHRPRRKDRTEKILRRWQSTGSIWPNEEETQSTNTGASGGLSSHGIPPYKPRWQTLQRFKALPIPKSPNGSPTTPAAIASGEGKVSPAAASISTESADSKRHRDANSQQHPVRANRSQSLRTNQWIPRLAVGGRHFARRRRPTSTVAASYEHRH